MSKTVKRASRSSGKRRLACAVGLSIAGLLFVILPEATDLHGAMSELDRMETVYGIKKQLAERKGEADIRLEDSQKALDLLDERLLDQERLAQFTRSLAEEAKNAGCMVRSINPTHERLMQRKDAKEVERKRRRAVSMGKKPPAEFIEWPVKIVLEGGYADIVRLLDSMKRHRRDVRVKSLTLTPLKSDARKLKCEVNLIGRGLREAPDGGSR